MASLWKTHSETQEVTEGKDAGTKAMAMMDDYKNCVLAEYVWLDAFGELRARSRMCTASTNNPDDCTIFRFDGSKTGQAVPDNCECFLVPRKVFDDPHRCKGSKIIVCEAVTPEMDPAIGNNRAEAFEIFGRCKNDVWCSFEQEYTLCESALGFTGRNVALLKGGEFPAGNFFYGAVGGSATCLNARDVLDEHYASCIAAGVKMTGCNIERASGQAAFSVGPCRGADAADHLIAARYLLARAAGRWNYTAKFHPSLCPVTGAGNGLHVHMSTAETRGDRGFQAIESACKALGASHDKTMPFLTQDPAMNAKRLSGNDGFTSSIKFFKYGISDRGNSVRVSRSTAIMGKGEFEDRRPGGDADPYLAAVKIFQAALPGLKPFMPKEEKTTFADKARYKSA